MSINKTGTHVNKTGTYVTKTSPVVSVFCRALCFSGVCVCVAFVVVVSAGVFVMGRAVQSCDTSVCVQALRQVGMCCMGESRLHVSVVF
jgi:hypothetical protein